MKVLITTLLLLGFSYISHALGSEEWFGRLRGPYPILSVPYHDDGSVDYDVLVSEAEFVADCGAPGFIWAQSNDAIDLLSLEERMKGAQVLVEAFQGRSTVVVLDCQGRDLSDMETLAEHVEILAKRCPSAVIAIACRPPHNARTQEDLRICYERLASIVRRPVIIQTYTTDRVPVPKSELLIELAARHPDIYGWVKEESGGADGNERMRKECAAPEIKTVFGAWGSYGWLDQYYNYGTRGLISERAAYADYLMRIWRAMEAGRDREVVNDLWARYLLMMNLKETIPGGHLRGFNLYVLKKRGIFKNYLSREPVAKDDVSGKWRLVDRSFSASEIAEIEERYSYLKKGHGNER